MIALLVGTTIVWFVLESASAHEEPEAHWSGAYAGALATGLTLLAVHATAIVEHVRRGGGSLVGLVVIAAGIALRIAAIRALGDDFVSVPVVPAQLATTGLYRWMRHPSELGLLIAATGAVLLLESPAAAVVTLLVLLPLSIARCRAEDRVLRRR